MGSSRRHVSVFAVVLFTSLAVAAAGLGGLIDAPTGAEAKKGKKKCQAGKEKQGCKLPSGASYSGESAAGQVTVTIASSGAAVSAAAEAVCAGATFHIGGQGEADGKAKVGGTMTFEAPEPSRGGVVTGTVKFLSAKKAKASLTVSDPIQPCPGTLDLILSRE